MTPSVPRQVLGQHFLRDAGVARAIVDLLAPTPADVVVEIGAGAGALTEMLARRAGRVIALEIDRALVARLRASLPAVEVIEADARTWPYARVERPPGGHVLVAGNLPYSAGTRILLALIRARTAVDRMAVMLQREVAERVAAPPGSKVYGSLSVLTQLYCDVRIALRVPPGAFRPAPQVDSAVLHLTPLPATRVPVADERRFETVVRAAFAQRRKMLANSLGPALSIPVEQAKAAARAAGIDPTQRAETLTIEQFAALTAALG